MAREFDMPGLSYRDELNDIEQRDDELERLRPDRMEQRDMAVGGRALDDEIGGRVFHPLGADELEQRRLRGKRPPSQDAA